MGLESVELVLAWEEVFGISISDEDAAQFITPRHVIDHVSNKLAAGSTSGTCLSLTTFNHVRRAICNVTGIPRRSVGLDSRLTRLFDRSIRQSAWPQFRDLVGLAKPQCLHWFHGVILHPGTVRDLVTTLTCLKGAKSERAGKTWSREEIRELLRQVIREHLAVQEFSDDDEFVRDLGIG